MAKRPRRLFPSKTQDWPTRVLILEPEWQTVSMGTYRSQVVASRWWYWFARDGQFDPVDGACTDDPDYMLHLLAEYAEGGSMTLVIGFSMYEIVTLLGISKQFRMTGWHGTKFCYSSNVCIVEVRKPGHRILFCDIRNWLPGDMSEIGEWIQTLIEPVFRFWPGAKRSRYYHVNVLGAVQMAWSQYKAWVEKNHFPRWSLTLSSLSHKRWLKGNSAQMVLRSSKEWVAKCERESYFGGFVYAHKTGYFREGPYYLLDANGLYASVMLAEKLPYLEYTTCRYPGPRDLDKIVDHGEPMVYGNFELPNGFLPDRQGRDLLWDHGPRDLFLAWPEVEWIREHGRINHVYGWILYKTDYILRDLVDSYYQRRLECKREGRRFEARLWKSAANFLYGKFGQRFGDTVVAPAGPDMDDSIQFIVDYETGNLSSYVVFCGSEILTEESGGGRAEVSSIAAWVTSHARVRLWRICAQAGWDHVFYNATDSLVVDQVGYERIADLISPDQPGMLKVEEVGDSMEIRGKNQYRVGGRVVDGTSPNYYLSDGDGRMIWVEREGLQIVGEESIPGFTVRVRAKVPWEHIPGDSVDKRRRTA